MRGTWQNVREAGKGHVDYATLHKQECRKRRQTAQILTVSYFRRVYNEGRSADSARSEGTSGSWGPGTCQEKDACHLHSGQENYRSHSLRSLNELCDLNGAFEKLREDGKLDLQAYLSSDISCQMLEILASVVRRHMLDVVDSC